jgi:hypothetical protein
MTRGLLSLESPRWGLRAERLAFGDHAQVSEGEDDPPAVQMKRHLLAVRACPERAFSHAGQAEAAQCLGCCRGAEHRRKISCRSVVERLG